MRKRNWDKLYSTYEKSYYKKAARSKVGMEDKYSKTEFKVMYTALENDRLKEVKKGERKVLNVTQDLVARQEKYLFSTKQARNIQTAYLQEYGDKLKLSSIRSGTVQLNNFWDLVKSYASTRSNNDPTVGQVFFGSP